ncbi:MAG: VWA-like domain-containing protein [Nitrososphaerota archaeon]
MHKKLSSALWYILKQHPFCLLADLFVKPKYIASYHRSLKDIASDSSWRVYYNPNVLDILPVREVAVLLCQAVLSLILKHYDRKGDRIDQIWNLASVLEINSLLIVHSSITKGIRVIEPNMFSMPDNLTAEDYYDRLVKYFSSKNCRFPCYGDEDRSSSTEGEDFKFHDDVNLDNRAKNRLKHCIKELKLSTDKGSASFNNGSGRGCASGEWELPVDTGDQKTSGLSKSEVGNLNSYVATRIKEIQTTRAWGDMPSCVQLLASAIFDSSQDYRVVLSSFCKNLSNREGRIRGEYNFQRVDRRTTEFILPTQRDRTLCIGILSDCSGSMTQEALNIIASETVAVIRQLKAVVHLWCHDVICRYCGKFDSENCKSFKFEGGGGTDVISSIKFVMDYCKNHKIRISGLLAFTDTYAFWPSEKPLWMEEFPVLVGTIHGDTAPSWVSKIKIA